MRRARVLSVDEATAALDEAEATLARWSGEAAEKAHAAEVLAGDLAEAQARAGDDLLDADEDEDPDALARIAGQILQLQTEQGIAVQAAERARERLTGVRREVLQARAGSVRARAARLRDVAASRQARTDQMLAELTEFERVAFAPAAAQNNLGIVGAPLTPRTLTQLLVSRAKWLDDHAGWLHHVAMQGAADEVVSAVSQPMPEQIEVESAALGTTAVGV